MMTCLPRETLRRFRDQALGSEEQESVEQHLASCETCRKALVADYREENAPASEPLPSELRTRVADFVGPPSRAWQRGLLSAAAGLLVIMGVVWVARSGEQEIAWRDLETISKGIEILEPAHRASLRSSTRFRWKAVNNAKLYRLVILTEVGERIFEWTGTETQIRVRAGDLKLDSHEQANRGSLSFFIEADLGDGRQITSTPQDLTLDTSSPSRTRP